MDTKIINTEIECMYDWHIDLYVCPCCNSSIVQQNKWSTNNFIRVTCKECNTYIYLTGKKFRIEEITGEK
jgi:transposase-like protein